MSFDQTEDMESDLPAVDELALLKERAKTLGIKHSPNIGIEALKERIAGVQSAPEAAVEEEPLVMSKAELRKKIRKDALKLIRIRISCMNPAKKDLPGEIITVANKHFGTIRKYIPLDESHSENGYHVPNCIYQFLRDRQFLSIRSRKDRNARTGIRIEQAMVKEYSIEVLPQLTRAELDKLAAVQKASGSTDKEF